MARRLFAVAGAPAAGAIVTIVMAVALAPQSAVAASGCSLPVNTTGPKTSDCLFILQTAVDLRDCALCICDVNDSGTILSSDALVCLKAAVGLEVTLDCPACESTTTTTLSEISSCPGAVDWTTNAGTGDSCTTNSECAVGACTSGRCRTASDLDLGWTGNAHEIDLDEGAVLRLSLDCELAGGTCGVCSIDGIDASAGNCRCGNDIRVHCNDPLSPDASQCRACAGGAFAGSSCANNAECVGGPCNAHCAFDPQIVCSTNSDCPTGRKTCDATLRCGNGDGQTCSGDNDCIGSCTGASTCECYDSPPQPVASVEFPFCLLPRFASDVTGTINVDTGAAEITKNLELVAYSGLSLLSPCPVCGGTCHANHQTQCSANADCTAGDFCELDPVARDGVRGGVCIGGPNDRQSCDVEATNTSFPARPGGVGGGGYSLDCSPDADLNFTGSGLSVRDVETTATSSLSAVVPCNPSLPSGGNCPCLMCSGGSDTACNTDEDCSGVLNCSGWNQLGCDSNTDCQDLSIGTCTTFGNTRCSGNFTRTCTSNADCQAADFGTCDPATCSSAGIGIFPSANGCTDGQCTADGDGGGHCATGPDDRFCDGVRKADGGGIVACVANVDCLAGSIGFNAGTCSLSQRRACFPDPIVATGEVDPNEPVTGATFCVPPTSGAGKNTSIGLPGPARLVRQATLEYFCASDPSEQYVPGVGGCP